MNLSVRRIAVIAPAVAVALLLIWYVALFRTERSDLNHARAQRATVEQQVSSLQSQFASLQALEKQVPADKARLATLETALPTNPDLTDVLNQLHALATASGVQLTSVNPSAQTSTTGSGGLQEVTLSMSAGGTYAQMTAFLNQLASMPRALVVNSLSVSSDPTGQLSVSMSAQVFYAAG